MEGQGKKWAVLIGIDFYIEGSERPVEYENLSGCVEDVRTVRHYIQRYHTVSEECMKVLTATTEHGTDIPLEAKSEWPTNENITNAIRDVTTHAQRGDLVYIHYSGHGARVDTQYSNLKGPNGLDEALVPTDIQKGGRYLRDVEFANLLSPMVAKGLIVTVVLDCCHSGSATRGSYKAQLRGSHQIDHSILPWDVPVPELRSATPTNKKQSAMEPTRARENWLSRQTGYTLLAACCPNEGAYETNVDGRTQGLLTYHLIKILSKLGHHNVPISHQRLHQMICAPLSTLNTEEWKDSPQNPMLIGTGYSSFFGVQKMSPSHTACVVKLGGQKNVYLNVGRAHGVFVGAEYSILPLETSMSPQQSSKSTNNTDANLHAVIKVTKVDGLESRAEVEDHASIALEVGCQAKLLSRFQLPETCVSFTWPGAPETKHKERLEALKHDCMQLTTGGVPLSFTSSPTAEKFSYNVTVNDIDECIISACENHLMNEIPKIKIGQHSDQSLVATLEHLARFDAIQELENIDSGSPLRDCFTFRMLNKEIDTATGYCSAKDEEIVTIELRNNDPERVLNFTIFDLNPEREIVKFWPGDSDYGTLDPGSREPVSLTMILPGSMKEKGLDACRDILLVMVTSEPRSFRSLEMPRLSEVVSKVTKRGRHQSTLEDFLEILSPRRHIRSPTIAVQDWQTAKISVMTMIDSDLD